MAAQTSRDRKKAKMDEMEHKLQLLVESNERLTNEVIVEVNCLTALNAGV